MLPILGTQGVIKARSPCFNYGLDIHMPLSTLPPSGKLSRAEARRLVVSRLLLGDLGSAAVGVDGKDRYEVRKFCLDEDDEK